MFRDIKTIQELESVKKDFEKLKGKVFKTEEKEESTSMYSMLFMPYWSPKTLEERIESLEKENRQLNNRFELLLKHLDIEYIKTTTDKGGYKNEVESFQPIKKQKKAKKNCECYED